MAAVPLNTSIPSDLDAELRAAAARTGIPIARLVQQGVRIRLDQLGPAAAHAPGAAVEWTGADGVTRFGVVMRIEDGLAQCTVDTFHGDPLHTVPVEVGRLRPRQSMRICHLVGHAAPVELTDGTEPTSRDVGRAAFVVGSDRAGSRRDTDDEIGPPTDIASIADDDAFWERLKSGGEAR